jgi:hypothetical protein
MGDRKPIGVAYRDQDIDGGLRPKSSLSEAVQLTLHNYSGTECVLMAKKRRLAVSRPGRKAPGKQGRWFDGQRPREIQSGNGVEAQGSRAKP